METKLTPSFNDLVEHYLDRRLPREMAAPIVMDKEPEAAKSFIIRLLDLMRQSGYPAAAFTPYFIRWLASVKTILPSAWEGQIPPLTVPDRHKKLDAYVKAKGRFAGKDRPVFLDLGCGFPPVTSADTAKALPDWQVFGADHSFPEYIVYDEQGHYACFDRHKKFQYFQAMASPSGRVLYQNPEKTRQQFTDLFFRLEKQRPSRQTDDTWTVKNSGCCLIFNHTQNFETPNLKFMQSDFQDIRLPVVQVIRGMNLLIYFEPETRKKMVRQLGALVDDDGIMIVGTNGLGVQARYIVYEKKAGELIPGEFAFGPDNLGPISFMAWFTIWDNDPEALFLAGLSRAIRSSGRFWNVFSHEMDRLLARHEICWRGADGFFQIPDVEQTYGEYLAKTQAMWGELDAKGYVDGVVDVLRKEGFTAWKNSVGDIAVRPDPRVCPLAADF